MGGGVEGEFLGRPWRSGPTLRDARWALGSEFEGWVRGTMTSGVGGGRRGEEECGVWVRGTVCKIAFGGRRR